MPRRFVVIALALGCALEAPPSRGPEPGVADAPASSVASTADTPIREPAVPAKTPAVTPEPGDALSPAEASTALAAAALPRFVAAARFPDNVWAAVVDPSTGQWSVDISDWRLPENSPLYEALATDDGSRTLALGPDNGVLPLGWSVGDRWTLVTSVGAVAMSSTAHALSVSDGSGQLFVHVGLGPAPTGVTGTAIALRGEPGRPPPLLRVLAPTRPDGKALARIHAAMAKNFDAESRPLARAAKLRPDEVSIHEGRFPGGRTQLAVVTHEHAADGGAVTLSAMVFIHADGSVEFFRQADVLGQMTLVGLVDLDGDGTDEVVFEDRYHEGWYVYLLHWRAGKPKLRGLAGDGL